MKLKQTSRSLSVCFVLIGLLALITNLQGMGETQGNLFAIKFLLPGIGFALAFIAFGISLKSHLVNSPLRIIRVLFAGVVYLGLLIANSLFWGAVANAIQTSVDLLVTLYLIRTVRRLSSEFAADTTAT